MISIRSTAFLSVFAATALAAAQQSLPTGTEVMLKFDQPLSSRTAKAGDSVRMEVAHDVDADGRTVLRAGTPVTGIIEKVDHNDHFGKNARIRLAINPVHGIALQPRDKGKPFVGGSTDHAAEAAGAGAIIFGPLGLAAGYFFTGKSVNVHPGDVLRTEVSAPG